MLNSNMDAVAIKEEGPSAWPLFMTRCATASDELLTGEGRLAPALRPLSSVLLHAAYHFSLPGPFPIFPKLDGGLPGY